MVWSGGVKYLACWVYYKPVILNTAAPRRCELARVREGTKFPGLLEILKNSKPGLKDTSMFFFSFLLSGYIFLTLTPDNFHDSKG